MPNAVDTRIVQMQFDNKDFERNIKTSDKSLSKFKENLDFSKYESGLNSFGKAVKSLTFDNLVDNVQKLTDKFTGLGNIGEMVISRIRSGIDGLIGKVTGLANSLGFEQITAGLDKYGQMNKNVQTIMSATGESQETVYGILERLNKYTDQTSYNFTDMASNIGKFTSVGIPLENAEKQMEGIANWAARSGAGIAEASRAMYNLSQAMGVGALTKIDWKSIENAGMATKEFKTQLIQAGIASGNLVVEHSKNGETIVKTAKKFGKQVEVTYKNVAETLQKKWADQDVLGKTLEGYYRSNLDPDAVTEPVIDLTKDQLKKIEKLYEDFSINKNDFGTLKSMGLATEEVKQAAIDAAVQMGNLVAAGEKDGKKIYKTNEKYGKQIEFTIDTIEKSLEVGWLDTSVGRQIGLMENLADASYAAAQKCTTLTDVFEAWKDQLSTGWMRTWELIFGELSESMELFSTICNKVGDSFGSFIEHMVGWEEELENGTTIKHGGIFGTWANLGGRDSLWRMLVGEYDDVYEGAYGLLDVVQDVGRMVSDGFWSMLNVLNPNGVTDNDKWLENEAYRTEWLGKKLKQTIDKVKDFIQGIKEFMNAVPEGQTKSRFKIIQDVVNGVFSTVAIVFNSIKDTFNFFSKLLGPDALGPILDDIIGIFQAFGNELTDTGKATSKGQGLKVFFEDLYKILVESGLFDALKKISSVFADLIKSIFKTDTGTTRTIGIWQSLASVLSSLAKVVAHVSAPIIDFFRKVISSVRNLASGKINLSQFATQLKDSLRALADNIFNFTPFFTKKVGGIFTAIKNVFTSGFSKESIDELSSKAKVLFDDLKKSMPEGVKTTLKSIYESAKNFGTNTFNKIKGFFTPLFTDIRNVFTSGFSKESVGQLKARFQVIFMSIYNKLPNGVRDAFTKMYEKIKKSVTDVYNRIKGFFVPLFNDIKNVFTSGFSKDSVDKLKTRLQSIFKKFNDAIPADAKSAGLKIVQKIKDFFLNIWTNIKDAISKFLFGGKEEKKTGKELKLKAKNGFESIKESTFDTLIDEGNKKKDGIISMIGKFFSNIWTNIKEKIFGIFGFGKKDSNDLTKKEAGPVKTAIVTFFDKLRDWFSGFVGDFKGEIQNANLFSLVKEWLGLGLFSKFMGGLSGIIKGTNLYAIAMSFLGATALIKVIKMFKQGSGLLGTMKGFFTNLQDTLKNGIKIKSDNKTESFGDKLLKIAKGIALIVAAVVVLCIIPLNKLAQGVIALGVIMGLILGFMFILKKVAADLKQTISMIGVIASIGIAIFAIGIGVAILLRALKPLSSMSIEGIAKMLLSLIAVLVILTVFLKYVNDNMGGSVKVKGVFSIAILAIAIGVLILALKSLSVMSWEGLGKMAAGLVFILGVLAIFSKNVSSMKGTGMMQVLLIAGAIWLLLESLKPLASYGWDQLAKMGVGLVALMYVLVRFTQDSQSMKGTKMGQMILVAASIFLILEALKPLANYNWEQLAKMGASLIVIAGVIVLFTRLMSGVKITDAGAMGALIGGVTGAIYGLVAALQPLAKYEWEDLAKMAAGLILMTAVIVIMTKLIKPVGDVKQGLGTGAVMLGLVAVIAAFALMFLTIKGVSWDQILAACLGMIAVITVYIVLISKVMKVKDIAKAAGMILLMIGLSVVIAAFALALKAIKDVDPKSILAFATGLTILIVGLAAAMLIMSKVNIVTGLAGILVLVVGLVAILGTLSIMIPIVMQAFASGLENMLAKLLLVSNMLSGFMTNMNSVSEGDLDSACRKFQKIMDMLGIIRGAGNYIDDIKAFEMAMLMLGNAIGQFDYSTKGISANLAEGNAIKFVEKVLSLKDDFSGFTIGNFADDLANLAEAVDSFNETEMSDATSANNKVGIIKDILALKSDFNGFSIGDFDSMLVNLGIAISSFGLTSSVGGAFAGIGIAAVKDILSFKDDLNGFSLGDFNEQVVNLGNSLKLFGEAVSGGGDKLGEGIQMIQDLAGQANNLDLLSKLPLDTLKSQIAGLGGALSIFATGASEYGEVKGLDEGDLPSVQKAVELLKTVVTSLSEDGGFSELPDLPSDTDLGDFGTELAALAVAMKKFADASTDLSNTDKAIELLGFLGQLQGQLTADAVKTAGVFREASIPTNVLTNFGIQIAALGDGLKSFASSTEDFSVNDAVYDALTFLSELKTRLTSDYVATALVFKDAGVTKFILTNFGIQVEALGNSLKKFGEATKDFKRNAAIYSALSFLVDLKSRLTKEYVTTALVFKDANVTKSVLTDFGIQLAALGRGLGRFYEKTKNFEKNQSVYDALAFFAELKEKLDPSVVEEVVLGVLGMKVDKDGLTRFGTQIGELGEALGKFAENVNFDADKQTRFEQAISALDSFSTLANKLPVVGGISGLIHGNVQTIGGLSEDVIKIGGALAEFSKALVKDGVEFRSDLVSSALGSLMSFADIIMYLSDTVSEDGVHFKVGPIIAAEYIGEFLAALNQQVGAYEKIEDKSFVVENAEGSVIAQLVNMIIEFDEWFDILDDKSKGLKHLDVFQAFRDMAAGIASLVNVDPSVDFSVVGANIAAGVKKGITDGTSEVVQATIDMCVAAIEAAKKTTDQASPSRVFAQIGGYMAEGAAIGIQKGTSDVSKASEGMANEAIESARDPLATLSALLAGDINGNPTITPILDLSNVEAGAQRLNGLFGNPYGLSLNGGTLSIDSTGASIYANSSLPTDYTTSIDGVKDEIANMRGDLQGLADAMSKMKFVFNSGAVVAAIGPEMDQWLGQQGYYAVRSQMP